MNPMKSEEHITLSASAIAHLHAIMVKDPAKNILRLTVDSGGCSGFQYQFELGSELRPDDLSFAHEGATLAVDPLSFEFVKGAQVDYVQELIGAAFVIKNPNASSSCGCGSSFSI
jgi:iron-sulfur cluster insertion protein